MSYLSSKNWAEKQFCAILCSKTNAVHLDWIF